MRAMYAQVDSLLKLKEDINVAALPSEIDRYANDKNKQDRFNLWLKNLKKDIYLDQAVKVVNDVINQQNLAKTTTPAAEEKPKKAF